MSQALLKIKATKHPISEATIGFRIQAAHPNQAGRNFKGQAVPSFAKKYLIAESSDHSEIGKKQMDNFLEELAFQRFDDFVLISDARAT